MLYNLGLILILWLIMLPVIPIKIGDMEPTPEPSKIAILTPTSGQALQGSVPIKVNTAVDGFQSAGLSFSYSRGSLETWFVIEESDEPISNGEWLQWDTTTITDGDYTLQLIVYFNNGDQEKTTVPDLRVRNYSPIETNTPVPTDIPTPGDTPLPTAPLTSPATLIPSTITPMPANPAQISREDIFTNLGIGALVSLFFFVGMVLYKSLSSIFRGRRG
jgi:hypothetical protein